MELHGEYIRIDKNKSFLMHRHLFLPMTRKRVFLDVFSIIFVDSKSGATRKPKDLIALGFLS